MYELIRQKIETRYGSVNKLSLALHIAPCDLYSAFKGTKPFYPKYKRLIAEALDEDEKKLFSGEGEK